MPPKIKIFSLIVLGLASIAVIAVSFFGPDGAQISPVGGPQRVQAEKNCTTSKDKVEVRGNSLSGILEAGDKVVADMGYYSCNEPKAGDIILFHWAGDTSPLIKVIRAVPGDKFSLKQNGDVWNILINGAVAKTTKGEPYAIASPNRLNLYVNDYKGVVPKDAYIILGNVSTGSIDSTVFGLAGKADMLAKVEK